ncbi:MAG: GntR family transcriptional regulator [Proteobacteria bacterium]|nr:GntR family transcriptional regulator [Pseudomonadota bacterium]
MPPTPDEPLYAQLTAMLRDRIAGMRPGEKIWSEPRLAKDLGVSRFTVARAIEQLVRDGLVVRRQGSGTYVAEQVMRQLPSVLLGFAEAVAASGQNSSQELRSFAPVRWRPDYPYPESEGLFLLDRLRLVNGRRMAWHRSVLSRSIVTETGLDEAAITTSGFSLYRHLEEHGHRAESAEESFHARLATPEEAALLDLPEPAAVISVRRVTRDAQRTVIDFVEALYDARAYSYRADLQRGGQSALVNLSKGETDVLQTGLRR